jgi:nitrite reductase/ring-hydroxylating ferredoxin subunit/uncharacterized membrane protein
MLIVFPFAYLVGSAGLHIWDHLRGTRRWQGTARDLNSLGLCTAVVAAVPGLVDYLLAVPPRSSGKQRATKHMAANLSALALFAAARRAARDGAAGRRPALWGVAAEAAGAGLLAAGGWLGGTLVYRNQIGVDHRYADAGKWQETAIPAQPDADALDVGAADELGVDQMKLVRLGGRRLVLARTEHGFAAFEDRCTHKGGPLSDGALICGVVQCPWHGSQFDVETGAVKHGPAEQPITTFWTFEREGRVCIGPVARVESMVHRRS